MGFFKKLFRRRKKKKDNGAFLASGNMAFGHDNVIRKPAFDNKSSAMAYNSFRSPPMDKQNSKSNTPGKKESPHYGSHDSSYGSSFDSSKDSYNRSSRRTTAPQAEEFSAVPFEADFSEFNNENNVNYANHGSPMNVHGGTSGNRNNRAVNLLNYEQVQQFEQQQTQKGYANPYGQPPSKKLQLTRLPSGQLVAMNSAVGRGAASPLSVNSDFDLSTDAEDNEYNRIREYGTNGRLAPMLGSPGSGSDDDKMLRPSFSSFDRQDSRKNKFYLSNSESEYESFNEGGPANRSRHYFSDSDNDRDSQGGASPSPNFSKGGPSPKHDSRFTFDTVGVNQSKSLSPGSTNVVSPGTTSDREPSPRAIAIQQAKQTKEMADKSPNDMYADSSDSENDTNDNKVNARKSPPKDNKSPSSTSRSEGIIENFVDFEKNAFGSSTRPLNRQTQSVADPMSPVSELLAQARQSRNNSKGISSASVNSAPNNFNDGRPHVPRPANNASSAAREKLMRRRREKKEWLRSNGGDSDDEDDESENGKDNESWLYNEVTGALGPQGIQADLESLGERSFRSRTSAGNRSLRSHRSQKSSSRRNRSSDASVGSRQSRASRASRASRYSIKSTKSHLSTMSAESRSVANDLIRLEMQLAMVGANKRGENTLKKELEAEAERKGITGLNVNRHSGNGSVAGSSVGGRSKSSSRSNSSVPSRPIVSNRQKTIVKAPPGKLGIILANKNDARGTVVSGVRTTSVLAHKISPGDRIIAIDGEDVSRMNVTEITSIMARKSDYERTLAILSSN